ncbi:MAG: type II toxin-antitoxin system RelE/ParE family toxin [Parvibaculaceae bacterium]
MIKSFKDAVSEKVFNDEKPGKGFPSDLFKIARRKLMMVHAAVKLDDLRSPPANRLEALKGDRAGQHSIRINDQFRVCFKWSGDGAGEVEICDYR